MRLMTDDPMAAGPRPTNASPDRSNEAKMFLFRMIASAGVVFLSTHQLSAQQMPEASDVMQNGRETALSELNIPVGHSTILKSPGRLATIIVGDNAVASAALGPGETIVLTGQGVGATNVIILGEEGEVLFSSQVDVVPATQDLTSTVIVRGGATTRQLFDCRGSSGCMPIMSELGLTEAPRLTDSDSDTSSGATGASE